MPNRIRPLRESAGLSIAELVVASGVPFTTIYALENSAERTPSVKTAVRLASALGVDVTDVATVDFAVGGAA